MKFDAFKSLQTIFYKEHPTEEDKEKTKLNAIKKLQDTFNINIEDFHVVGTKRKETIKELEEKAQEWKKAFTQLANDYEVLMEAYKEVITRDYEVEYRELARESKKTREELNEYIETEWQRAESRGRQLERIELYKKYGLGNLKDIDFSQIPLGYLEEDAEIEIEEPDIEDILKGIEEEFNKLSEAEEDKLGKLVQPEGELMVVDNNKVTTYNVNEFEDIL